MTNGHDPVTSALASACDAVHCGYFAEALMHLFDQLAEPESLTWMCQTTTKSF